MAKKSNKEVRKQKIQSSDADEVTIAMDARIGACVHDDGTSHSGTPADVRRTEEAHRSAPIDEVRAAALVVIDHVPSPRLCVIEVTKGRVDGFLLKLDRLLRANFRVRLTALEDARREVREALQP